MRFSTFDQVAKWYEDTKPVISKYHDAGCDVRPIGERRRKWERIKKVNDNTYALCDGMYGWASAFVSGNNSLTPEQMQRYNIYETALAPIVWTRREDGDYIRIRNHNHNNTSVSRYNFIKWYLPLGMAFRYNQQGKHWLEVRVAMPETGLIGTYEKFPLPKCRVTTGDWEVVNDDGRYLEFRVNGDGTFTRVSAPMNVKGNHVDKDLKKQWREHLESFYGYCAAIAPMMDLSWDAKNEYRNQIAEWVKENLPHRPPVGWVRNTYSIPPEVVRGAVSQEDHPLRVAIAAYVISDIDGKKHVESQEDVRRIRASYNRVMNRALDFYKTEEI